MVLCVIKIIARKTMSTSFYSTCTVLIVIACVGQDGHSKSDVWGFF